MQISQTTTTKRVRKNKKFLRNLLLLSLLLSTLSLLFIFKDTLLRPWTFKPAVPVKSTRTINIMPHEMPASMFKEHLITLCQQENPKTFDYLYPLMLMATKQHRAARALLAKKSNLSNEIILSLRNNPTTFELANMIEMQQGQSVATACKKLLPLIQKLDVTPANKHQYKRKGYGTYYADKNEDFSLESQKNWGNKQRNIYKILSEVRPETVLDLGANAGWFTRLAESFGAHVVATDIDEYCCNYQCDITKERNLNIQPMILPFEKSDRSELKSDVVMCLALVHHLVFLGGLKLDEIFKTLAHLTKKKLILEYIDIEDKTCKGAIANPNFFKNKKIHNQAITMLNTYGYKYYNIDNFLRISQRYFREIEVYDSSSTTRKLLLLSK